jgi:hypothetical protein
MMREITEIECDGVRLKSDLDSELGKGRKKGKAKFAI